MTFIVPGLEIPQKLKNRKKLRVTNSLFCLPHLTPYPHPSSIFCHSLTCYALEVPTRDCVPKLTSLTCKWCSPLASRCFRQGNTSRRSEGGGRERLGYLFLWSHNLASSSHDSGVAMFPPAPVSIRHPFFYGYRVCFRPRVLKLPQGSGP